MEGGTPISALKQDTCSGGKCKRKSVTVSNKDIEHLVNDINESLTINDKNSDTDVSTEGEIISDNQTDTEPVPKKKSKYSLQYFAKEGLLLLVLFIILSQPMIRNAIGNYVPHINPKEDGALSLLGVLIYGVILST